MRPPYCEICDVEVDPSDDVSVAFASSPSEASSPEGAAIVGGDDDRGWFCAEHVGAARALTDRSLADAVTVLRGGTGGDPPASEHADRPHRRVPIAPIGPGALSDAFELCLPEICRLFDFDPPPLPLPQSARRRWSPMDGCQPPWCPYVDEWWREGITEEMRVRISSSASHWNDDDVANCSAGLAIWRHRRAGGEELVCSLGAYGADTGTGRPFVDTLSLSRLGPRHDAALALVVDLVGPGEGP
ncbi:MAG: hypothetical protein AAF962_05705 [Actinomycetota bacterium]